MWPWWTAKGMVDNIKSDEWKEPLKAFVDIAQTMKQLAPWMKLFMGSFAFVMITLGLINIKILIGG